MAESDVARIPRPGKVLFWLALGVLATFVVARFDAEWIAAARGLDAAVESESAAFNDALKWWTQAFGRIPGGIAAGLVLLALGRSGGAWRKQVVTLLLALVFTGVYVAAFKVAVGRARPGPALRATASYETLIEGPAVALVDPQYRSFPSGHTASAAAAAAVVSACQPALAPVVLGLTAIVGLERVYDAKHYPSDVVAGGFTGWLIGWFVFSTRARGNLRMPWEARAPTQGAA